MSSSPAGSGTKALARGDPLGSVTSGVHTRFVFQSISRLRTVLSAGRGESAPPDAGVRRCPGRDAQGREQAPGQQEGKGAGGVRGGSRPGGGRRWPHLPGRPGESAGSASEAGAALGGHTRGERKRATCSCDRGFDLHPGSGHSPFQGELERLGDTAALSPRLIKSLAVGRYFHIQAGQNRNADQLL